MTPIYATCTGSLVHTRPDGDHLVGRIVLFDGEPVQITARRGVVKRALEAMPMGIPIAVSGKLKSSVANKKDGRPYVRHEIEVSTVQTAQQQETSFISSILQRATQ